MSERGGIVLSRRLFLVGVGAAAVAAIAKVCVPIVHPHDCLVLLDSDEPLTIFSISMNASAADPYSNVSVRRDGQTLIRLAAQRYGWCEYQAPLGGGIVVAKGKHKLATFVAGLLEGLEDHGLSERMRVLIADMRAQWAELDRRIRAFDVEFATFLRGDYDKWGTVVKDSGAKVE